jgi:aldehyde dehydrogenase (NAD+)
MQAVVTRYCSLKNNMKPHYINHQWVESDIACPNINPSDISDRIDDYGWANAALVNQAVAAAHQAFPTWGKSSIQTRADALDQIGSEIIQRRAELADLLAREEGKVLAEASAEVLRAGQIFKFFAGEALRMRGQLIASVRPGCEVEVLHEPIGVVGLITPWNFPIAIPAWKIAPALAYGNCVVFKPSELAPGCAWALAEIISRAGLPAGVFNLVMGSGNDVGQALIESDQINAISFTGSVATGKKIAQAAMQHLTKLQLEMGGKNPLVVLDDAHLETAVNCAVNGAYFSAGQRCTASSRLIVTKNIYKAFVDALVKRLRELNIGDARAPSSDIGPVVDQQQLDKNLRYIVLGQEEGARLVFGGDRLKRAAEGYYLSPALFIDADNAMRIAREEIFGPVACVIPADNYEHALEIANDSDFGLSAGICTTALKTAMHFKHNAQAGMVMVNLPTAGVDYHVPFGGTKASSYGPKEQGAQAMEFFTRSKTAYTAY